MKVTLQREHIERREVDLESAYFIGEFDCSATRYYIKVADPCVIVEPYFGGSVGSISFSPRLSVLTRGYNRVTPITEAIFDEELDKVIKAAKGGEE